MRKFNLVNERNFKGTYGALYEDFDTTKGKKVLLEPFFFLFRRILIAWIVIYGTYAFIWQMTMVFAVMIFQIAIPFLVESRKLPADRRLVTFGESTTLFVAHTFIMFNMVSVEDNFTVGYWVITIVGFYCLVNFIIIFRSVFLHYKVKCKVRKAHNKYRRYRAKFHRNL